VILSRQSIRSRGILSPCEEPSTCHGTSYGLGPAGYDLRLVLPQNTVSYEEYPKRLLLQPGQFMLAAAAEYFSLPSDLVGIVHDKSTWARRGLTVQNTIIEPGWRGYLTLELINHSNQALELVEGQGIAQVVFHVLDQPTDRLYSGKYQNQQYGPQEARS